MLKVRQEVDTFLFSIPGNPLSLVQSLVILFRILCFCLKQRDKLTDDPNPDGRELVDRGVRRLAEG